MLTVLMGPRFVNEVESLGLLDSLKEPGRREEAFIHA